MGSARRERQPQPERGGHRAPEGSARSSPAPRAAGTLPRRRARSPCHSSRGAPGRPGGLGRGPISGWLAGAAASARTDGDPARRGAVRGRHPARAGGLGARHRCRRGLPRRRPRGGSHHLNLVLDALDEAYEHIVVFGGHATSRILFEAIEGRFDAGIVVGDNPSSTRTLLGFAVVDIDVLHYAPPAAYGLLRRLVRGRLRRRAAQGGGTRFTRSARPAAPST